MCEFWRCDGERELLVSAAVMPPRCALSYCCKCAELCKSISLVLESMLFMPGCSNNIAQNKDENTKSKEGNEKTPGCIRARARRCVPQGGGSRWLPFSCCSCCFSVVCAACLLSTDVLSRSWRQISRCGRIEQRALDLASCTDSCN